MKIEQATTQHLVDISHINKVYPYKPVGSHIVIGLSQSKSEVSHALNAHYHGNQCNSSLGLNREDSKLWQLITPQ